MHKPRTKKTSQTVGLAVYKQLHGSRLNCHATCPKPPATSSLPWRHVKASLHPCAVHGSASWAWAEVGPFCCILPYAALHAPAACHDSRFLRAMLGQMLRFRASASSHLFATAKSTSRSTCAWTVPAHCLMSTRCLACLAHMPTLLDPRSNEPILAPSHAVESILLSLSITPPSKLESIKHHQFLSSINEDCPSLEIFGLLKPNRMRYIFVECRLHVANAESNYPYGPLMIYVLYKYWRNDALE
ncbi:hypothetical protein ZIOFF_019665 [Zingiber officinale]|uniref:Uncharacterized protein n=1 Tax=Zingiber officinale TaxID=94328 RepID=A0A8J5LT88_ZINOF|nr:hypothetical protein ZIOFF_019665 [Zingiber officinale]